MRLRSKLILTFVSIVIEEFRMKTITSNSKIGLIPRMKKEKPLSVLLWVLMYAFMLFLPTSEIL